jgi:hypothetical protein
MGIFIGCCMSGLYVILNEVKNPALLILDSSPGCVGLGMTGEKSEGR